MNKKTVVLVVRGMIAVKIPVTIASAAATRLTMATVVGFLVKK